MVSLWKSYFPLIKIGNYFYSFCLKVLEIFYVPSFCICGILCTVPAFMRGSKKVTFNQNTSVKAVQCITKLCSTVTCIPCWSVGKGMYPFCYMLYRLPVINIECYNKTNRSILFLLLITDTTGVLTKVNI